MTDLDRFVREDLGRRGDVTTQRIFGRARIRARAVAYAREPVVAAGLAEASAVFARFGARAAAVPREGAWVRRGAPLLRIQGPLPAILGAERLALNILGRMCGIATATRRLVERVRRTNPRCRVAATRKTTPGFRRFEKRAVVVGGGEPHRMGLFDQVLIKDNHLDALGGDVAEAVRRARRGRPRLVVEVEVRSAAQARAAAEAGADWILVDNATPSAAARIAAAARRVRPKVRIEISGGLRPENVARYALVADRLSVGALTHSARSADVTLDLVPKR